MTQRKWRVDLHMHSWFSADAVNSPALLVRRARAAGLDRVAVTDHDSIDGAFAASQLDPDLIIPGTEVRCANGAHLIGLFLRERIPGGLSVEATAARIREQGGVVYAPHPYAYMVRPQERAAAVLAVADVVEVFNSRAFAARWNRLAAAAADRHGLPQAAGTDAHMPWEIGRAYTEMPAFADAESFLHAVRHAQPGDTNRTSAIVHGLSVTSEVVRRAIGRGHGIPLRK